MSVAFLTESHLFDIAEAIRYKLISDTLYKPSEMAPAIRSIQTGNIIFGNVEISQNGGATIIHDGLALQLSNLLTWNNTVTISQ